MTNVQRNLRMLYLRWNKLLFLSGITLKPRPIRFRLGDREMSYVYSKAASLDGEPLVGSHQCVALVQIYASALLRRFRMGDIQTAVMATTPRCTYVKMQMEFMSPINGRKLGKRKFPCGFCARLERIRRENFSGQAITPTHFL